MPPPISRLLPQTFDRTVFLDMTYRPGSSALGNVGRKNMIACTSRSGSMHLCHALRDWGLNFAEWFNPTRRVRMA